MKKRVRIFLYFSAWMALALTAVLLNIINVDWSRTNIVNGLLMLVVLSVIQGSVLEITVQTIAAIIVSRNRKEIKKISTGRLTVLVNYNLLATSTDDIDECFEKMYEGYISNIGPNVSAVLVSTTNEEELKRYELKKRDTYRDIIYKELFREGVSYTKGDYESVDPFRLNNVWQVYEHIDPAVFVREYLDDVCHKYAREFMVLHRVSRVLRKCGQYQDLMLLSEGVNEAFSYCDPEYYGKSARPYGQPLFHSSDDVNNIIKRKFDYTLVLDADSEVPKGFVTEIMQIAAAHPERAIIQPAIKLHCKPDDTIFMHLEYMKQATYTPMINAIMTYFGQSGFFGKALIQNRLYIDKVIGTKDKTIDRVPVDVLSHDTFEAAILKPLYAGSVHLLEAPSYNYITWNIRERRWNKGEILLAMYFWPNAFGKPMRFLQKIIQRQKYNKTKVRTPSKLDFVSSYLATLAIRQMFMRPLLLLYIFLHTNIHFHYPYISVIILVILVIVFPKITTCNKINYKGMFLETMASIFQFTPDAVVGTVRIFRSLVAIFSPNVQWIPQRAIEHEFIFSNPFVSSLKHLWGYSLFALIASVAVCLNLKAAFINLFMCVSLFLLPVYNGFTSLSPNLKCSFKQRDSIYSVKHIEYEESEKSTEQTY